MIQLFIKLLVVGVNRVHDSFREVEEFHHRRICGILERIDLEPILEHLDRSVGFPIHQEAAENEPVDVRRRLHDIVIVRLAADSDGNGAVVVGKFNGESLVVRRQDEVLATLAAVGTGRAHVHHKAEEGVVDRAGSAARRNLDDGGAIPLEIENGRCIDRVGVASEEQWIRVHQIFCDPNLVGIGHPGVHMPHAHRLDRTRGHPIQEDLDRPEVGEVVVDLVGRPLGRPAVGELERAEVPGLDRIRRHDLGRNLRVVTRWGLGHSSLDAKKCDDRRKDDVSGLHVVISLKSVF